MRDVLCKTAAMSVFSNITDPFIQISLQQYKKYEFSLTSMAANKKIWRPIARSISMPLPFHVACLKRKASSSKRWLCFCIFLIFFFCIFVEICICFLYFCCNFVGAKSDQSVIPSLLVVRLVLFSLFLLLLFSFPFFLHNKGGH